MESNQILLNFTILSTPCQGRADLTWLAQSLIAIHKGCSGI